MDRLFNDKVSIKSQILCSFFTIVFSSGGITIAICLGILYGTANTAIKTAETTIITNTKSNVLINAKSIAGAIGQQLQAIADSVSLVETTYASVLVPTTSYIGSNSLISQRSYREYNFYSGCSYPYCPKDYGPFNGKTRLPPLANFTSGSIAHSSTYLYSSTLCTQYNLPNECGSGARTNSTWNSVAAQDPNINLVINSMAFQDIDLKNLYFQGPNTTVMFYVSSMIGTSSSFTSVHRTYPGITKASSPTYNPPGRQWFKKAPINGVYMYGPYQETFTRQLVITLSSRQVITGYYNAEPITLVVASVFLLTDLQRLILGISYTDGGFGALVAASNLNVIVWGKTPNFPTFDANTGNFLTLSQVDSRLAGKSIKSEGTFEYTDAQGVNWIVASVPFFVTSDYTVPNSASNSLIMLVFSRKSDAESPLPSLRKTITETTTSVTIPTVIILGATIGGVMLLVVAIVAYITQPLEKMRHISKEIVRIAAEEEEKKDYSAVVEDTFFNQHRSDEIGGLSADYFNIVCLLNNKTIQKREKPKYPPNSFHVNFGGSPITWEFVSAVIKQGSKKGQYVEPVQFQQTAPAGPTDSLDILGGMNARVAPKFIAVPTSDPSASVSINVPTPAGYVAVNETPKTVNTVHSIKTKFYCISFTLLILLLVIMLITVIKLAKEGANWMDQTSVVIESKQMQYIDSASEAKAALVQAYFEQINMDVVTAYSYVNAVANGTYSNPASVAKNQYLPSYSLDPLNPYAVSTPTASPNTAPVASSWVPTFSGYFAPGDAGCQNTGTCGATYISTLSKITSVLDLKLQGYLYPGSFVSLLQIGFEAANSVYNSGGYLRSWPYATSLTGTSQPTSCLVATTNTAVCASKYVNSACSSLYPPAGTIYPAYDARCRSWYQFAVQPGNGVPGVVYYQYPRASSSGAFVVTAVTPIKQGGTATGQLIGVLNFNVLVTTLSNSLNALKILSTGYSYLVDSRNTSMLIISPYASKSCARVACAEGFTSSEYTSFYNNVLMPIQTNALTGSNKPVATVYKKKGQTWRLAYASVQYGTIDYTVIVTVPRSEVLAAATIIQTQINSNVGGMIAAFVICIVVFGCLLGYFSILLVRAIVDPIISLRHVLGLVTADDLTGQVPEHPSSKDMKVLLDAFANLMVALRFGSDSYARGKKDRALAAFQEALQLYSTTGNKRGIASAHNNLGAIQLELQNFSQAQVELEEAISMGEKMLAEMNPQSPEAERMRRTISDRKGNLAVVYLQANNYPPAFQILEQQLLDDQRSGYIMGCIVKQGILGHYYLRQGEIKSAERVFTSALDFVTRKDSSNFSGGWNIDEADVAEQIATFNFGCLKEAQGDLQTAEIFYLRALCVGQKMHTPTAKKIFTALQNLYTTRNDFRRVEDVRMIAKVNNFEIGGGGGGPKRVAFILDYSGSMSGQKIRSAVDSLQTIFKDNISESDSAMLIHFTNFVYVDFDILPKKGNEGMMLSKIASLNQPTGTTALYDSIGIALDSLSRSPTSNDWIIALTDGEDNASKNSHKAMISRLQAKNGAVNLIVIGVGSDVETAILEALAKATPKGTYVFASGDSKSIVEAFGQAIAVIQEQIVLED